MSEQGQRVEAEQLAAEKYRIIAIDGVPSGYAVRNAFVDGYLAARTITTEGLEAAAKALDKNFDPDQWPVMAAMFRGYARAAFEAVGFYVEGEER